MTIEVVCAISAGSAKVTAGPAHFAADSVWLRVPIVILWPVVANLPARAVATRPDPRIPIVVMILLIIKVICEVLHLNDRG
jgi:hypothetical protein